MKDFLKDYGTLIGPLIAFTLGVIALYIKFYIDRQVENWKSKKKMAKLIKIIQSSKPPLKYYPLKSKDRFFHADQARNLTNVSIFYKRLEVILAFMGTVENDILTNCSVIEIQQFHDLKFIVTHLATDVNKAKNKRLIVSKEEILDREDFNEIDFLRIHDSYNRLIIVSKNPDKEFKYID
ncbi:hypothetical protein [Flavobacterium sp. UBA7680]|uniref:hypothetical protein n=1 Tax=Flavobacterium sp. UBA7680 TaxID=1946559 RepID=UPI0025BDB967|nr:hypothetical protein [Flavobacterium sp. UBA7680]